MSESIGCNLSHIPPSLDWFESRALDGLKHVSQFEGMKRVVAFPDMHSGADTPNGAAFLSDGIFYPHLIGNDIGCGYSLRQTDIVRKKFKVDKAVKKLQNLDQPWDGDTKAWLSCRGLASSQFDLGLGSIGGGNHFAEIQSVHEIIEKNIFDEHKLDKENVFVMVHSGSRGLGQFILRAHVDKHRAAGLYGGSVEANDYFNLHDYAVQWAQANRELIARRLTIQLNADSLPVLDLPHNSIERFGDEGFLHRKGSSPTNQGLLVIPGSRGALTYLVQPLINTIENAWSTAHGAGRKWDRNSTESRMRQKFRKEELLQTSLGSRVICEDKSLLFQEAPHAYKNIERVIQFLVEAKCIKIIATLKPLITYKKRSREPKVVR